MFKHTGVLRYWKSIDAQPTVINNPTHQQLMESLQVIPAGAVFICMSDSFVSTLIGLYALLKNFFTLLFSGFRVMFSHAGLYFGNGSNMTIEAEANGVVKDNFKRFLNNKHRVKVFFYKDMTVLQLQKMKEYAYQQLGKSYDYAAFAKFIIQQIQQNEAAHICTELVARDLNFAGIPDLDKDPAQIHPFEDEQYFEGDKGFRDGHRKLWEWGV